MHLINSNHLNNLQFEKVIFSDKFMFFNFAKFRETADQFPLSKCLKRPLNDFKRNF